MKRAILVFLKFPEAGKVKTRLAESIGLEPAAIAYKRLVAEVLRRCRKATPDLLAIAFDPVHREDEIRTWLRPHLSAFFGELCFIPQPQGDLGKRLEQSVAETFRLHPDIALCVIGTDTIHLESGLFEKAWERVAADRGEVVFGPSEDGGYYLIALSEEYPNLFRRIPWSSQETLKESLLAAERERLEVTLLEERFDVDTREEWERVAPEIEGRRCVFFDRDGVVNHSPGPGYVLREEDFYLNNGIAEALQWLQERNVLAIVVTSQRGVGKGLMNGEALDAIHGKMQRELAKLGVGFDAIYAYTETPDCPYPPKPEPGMINSALESFSIDPRLSWMIGDADRDIEMGVAAGLAGTIRICGEKPIGFEADRTIQGPLELIEIFNKFL